MLSVQTRDEGQEAALVVGLGLPKIFGQREDRARFDVNLSRHHHYRFVKCGLMRDFESTELNNLSLPASVNRFGDIVTTQVEVYGVCIGCAINTGYTNAKTDSSVVGGEKS